MLERPYHINDLRDTHDALTHIRKDIRTVRLNNTIVKEQMNLRSCWISRPFVRYVIGPTVYCRNVGYYCRLWVINETIGDRQPSTSTIQ